MTLGGQDKLCGGAPLPYRRALVLGATGTVGARLSAVLRARGVEVTAFAREDRSRPALEQLGYQVAIGHLGDPDSIAAAAVGAEVAFHCAGESAHCADPEALNWLHIAGTDNVVAATRASGVRRLVVLSCADVRLQDRERVHIREDQPMLGRALGPWARTKLISEEVALQSNAPSFEVTAVRPGYLWGAGDLTNLPGLCDEARRGGVRLFGGGSGLFSVAHVDNVVHGLLLASCAARAPGQAFHICDGEYETAAEFFGALSSALSWPRPKRSLGWLSRGAVRIADAGRAVGGRGRKLPDVVRRGRACLLDMQRAINDLQYAPIIERATAMGGLLTFVESQGGTLALSERQRVPAGRHVVSEFESFVKLAET